MTLLSLTVFPFTFYLPLQISVRILSFNPLSYVHPVTAEDIVIGLFNYAVRTGFIFT